jgi:DnaK suppressor protein
MPTPKAKAAPAVATKTASAAAKAAPVATPKVAAPKATVAAAPKATVAAAPKATVAAAPKTASAAKPAAPMAVMPKAATVLSMNGHKKYAGLTEAEVLVQPESDYMSKDQLAFFREKLVELRGQILHNATDTGEHLRDNEVATDPSDRATQEEEYTLELRTRDRERKLLKKVDKVIRMVDDGSFGWCEETGEPIGLARLIARPTATLSIEAQERRERMQKLFGD